MEKYRVKEILRLFYGLIELDEDQAISRRINLMATDIDGVYKIDKPIEFKVGEVVGLDFVDKAVIQCVEQVEQPIIEPVKKKGRVKK
jgi:hypothetical protein